MPSNPPFYTVRYLNVKEGKHELYLPVKVSTQVLVYYLADPGEGRGDGRGGERAIYRILFINVYSDTVILETSAGFQNVKLIRPAVFAIAKTLIPCSLVQKYSKNSADIHGKPTYVYK